MEDESIVPAAAGRKKPFILFRLVQWAITTISSLLLLALLSDTDKLKLVGAPVATFWLTSTVIAALALMHAPPIFFRLRSRVKLGAYAGILGGFVLLVVTIVGLAEAYESTPEGAKKATIRRQAEAKGDAKRQEEAAQQAEAQKALADLASAKASLEDLNRRQQACLSWGGELPALRNAVKESLHNPSSFEHVGTVITVPDESGNNIAMRFRAENGFGAIRTATVKAQLITEGCTVQNITEPVSD